MGSKSHYLTHCSSLQPEVAYNFSEVKRSHKKENAWKAITEKLNASVTWSFKVQGWLVREKLTGIVAKHKQKN